MTGHQLERAADFSVGGLLGITFAMCLGYWLFYDVTMDFLGVHQQFEKGAEQCIEAQVDLMECQVEVIDCLMQLADE